MIPNNTDCDLLMQVEIVGGRCQQQKAARLWEPLLVDGHIIAMINTLSAPARS